MKGHVSVKPMPAMMVLQAALHAWASQCEARTCITDIASGCHPLWCHKDGNAAGNAGRLYDYQR